MYAPIAARGAGNKMREQSFRVVLVGVCSRGIKSAVNSRAFGTALDASSFSSPAP
jgi:hypothetical protein